MQLTNISISAVRFDNQPFVRSLTATLMNTTGTQTVKATGSNLVSWVFPTANTYALMPTGSAYTQNVRAPVSAIGTLYFYFSAAPYDFKTTNYTLCTLNIRASRFVNNLLTQTVAYNQIYDTFPNIDLNLFVNYENTDANTLFYRLTSNTPFNGNVRLNSTSYNLVTALNSNTHSAWFTLNKSTTKRFLSGDSISFSRGVPVLSTVQAFLTASSAPGSLFPWFSAHSLTREISARFIPEFPTATFVAYPSTYFPDPYSRDFTLLTVSPGVCFYGEGHTENIVLCAAENVDYNHVWRINNSLQQYTIVKDTLNTAYAVITSQQNLYPTLPISLILSNNYILSSGPYYYIDDSTGQAEYYPFYNSTIDLSGNESSNNTKYRHSIRVNPYDSEFSVLFNPGADPTIYLPLNGEKRVFNASLNVFINNPGALSACFDRYNTIWKWSTFTECSAITTPTYAPSSWATVECSGTFPKKWIREGLDNPPVTSPIVCSLSSVVWRLSASTPFKPAGWTDLPIIETPTFSYALQLSEYGGELDVNEAGFTVSRFSDTYLTLNVLQTAYCTITANLPGLTSNDWSLKPTILDYRYFITSIEPYELKIYTPNRYVLTNTPVKIENLFERAIPSVTALEVELDDVAGQIVTLTGSEVGKSFTVSYSSVGGKTIKFTGYSQFYSDKYTVTYPNLFQVLEQYDTVNPEAYYSINDIVNDLPWKEQPSIGANDWVVSSNINSCIKKFYDNLTYLEKRNYIYSDTYNDYFGWLGAEPTVIQGLTSCPVWTWEDIDCTNPDNEYFVPWSAVMSGGVIPEVDETGQYARCGTWEQQVCPLSSVVPNCLGKFCLEWRWSSRKSTNSTALVTWKDTQCVKSNGKYPKTWKQPLEECETVVNINCDEGLWNVNIPGLDSFYDPIPVCFSQNRCSYRSIASYDNILYLAQSTQIKLLSSNRTATFFDLRTTFNDATPFVDIRSIALDSQQKLYILDGALSQIAVYEYKMSTPGERWALFTTFGGVGGSLSKTKFLNPTELHIDQYDNLWVVDTGNFVIKQFTNTGSWLFTLRDDNFLRKNPPISVCVDAVNSVHVLTKNSIRVYTYRGDFQYEYQPGPETTPLTNPQKITTNYNREIIYISSKSHVIRHFRTGRYSGTILKNKKCVDNINDVFHDEYRNLLIANDDKILKYVDTMTIVPLKSPLPQQFWPLNDLLIHEEEYVQNWVYTKILHRLWDNIEIFRNTLLYSDTGSCKRYKPPIHAKEKITIGQNEIVTSPVINRCLKYLWENFQTIMEYYNPNC